MRPRLGSYQASKSDFKKKQAECTTSDYSEVKPISYKPVGDITSFDNPAYITNPTFESYDALPGVVQGDDPVYSKVDEEEPVYSKVDEEEKKLDLEEDFV